MTQPKNRDIVLTPQELHDFAMLAGILRSYQRSGWIWLIATLGYAVAGVSAYFANSLPWLVFDLIAACVCCWFSRSNFRLSRVASADDAMRALSVARSGR